MRAFFEACEPSDPDFRFAFTAKVMLAVPGWGELQRRFVERAQARLAGEPLPSFVSRADLRKGRARRARAWGRMLRSLLRALIHRPPPGLQAEVLVFTLAATGSAGGRDAYFGSLAQWLGAGRTATVYLAAGAQASLPRGARQVPLEAYASAGDVLAAWREGLRANLAAMPGEPGHAVLAARFAREEIVSGETFMQALMRRAFGRMLSAVRPRVLVYPFENRSWEKSLVRAARAAGVERIVGYQHSSITPRHLAFELGAAAGRRPLPDRVIAVGSVTAQWLGERAPALAGRITIGASLRRANAAIALPAAHGLLVAISSSRDEALALIQMLHATAPAIRMPVVLRSHPTIPAADLYARFKWPGHVRLSAGSTLEEDLAAATIVAYSSSTVALEGMLQGRLPLFVDIGDVPAADPLIGDCPAKELAADARALAARLEAICGLAPAELEARRSAAKRYAEEYLREPSETRKTAVVAEILGAPAAAGAARP